MKGLSNLAKIYILLTILVGLVLSLWQLRQLEMLEWWLLLLAATAAGAQMLKIEGPTENSSYNISWLVYGFAFVMLGAPAAVVVILVAHAVEWIRYKYPWYIQLFNMGSYTVAITMAGFVSQVLNPGDTPMTLTGAVGSLLAAVAFTFLNHLMVGLVVKLARGESFVESGVFGFLSLIMDFTMFGMGAASALLWRVNPVAITFNLIPLYLFYNALKVPALQRQVEQLEGKLEELNRQSSQMGVESHPG
jgi:hypothetical protein